MGEENKNQQNKDKQVEAMSNSNEIDETTAMKQGSVWSSVLKWVLVFALLAFVCISKKDLMIDAIEQIKITPKWKIILCVLLGNLYFVFEGAVISSMTRTCDKKISYWDGLVCAYFCTFYRIATLGSGSGIAQIYFFNTKGIRADVGTGMTLTEYTFHKITIGIFGVVAFVLLILAGDKSVAKYAPYMLAGAVVISLICIFLFILSASKGFSDWVMKLGRKIVKKSEKLNEKLDKAQVSIDYLQAQGRLVWKDKTLFLLVVLLNILKLSAWYAIPAVFYAGNYGTQFMICLLLMSICNMVGCVMIAPSGVGTLDFVFAMFFGAIIPNGEALAAALVIYRMFTWMVPFAIGMIPAFTVKKKK